MEYAEFNSALYMDIKIYSILFYSLIESRVLYFTEIIEQLDMFQVLCYFVVVFFFHYCKISWKN